MGLVVVGEAFFKTGLADFIGGKIIGLLGKTEKGLLLGTGLVAGGLSAFLNDTGSTACLMPIVSSMASKAGVKKSKLLMALAFFASLGGTITLVGTTPHIVANGILKDMGLREFGFFEYTKIGLPLLVCGILYMCFCGTQPAGLGSRRLLCEGLPQVRLPHADHLRCRHHRSVRSVLPVSTL